MTTLQTVVARLQNRQRPLPSVTVEHGPAVPGWLLRALFVLLVPLLPVVAANPTALGSGLVATTASLLALWAALRPGSDVSSLAVAATAVLLLGSPGPFQPTALWLAPLAYLTTRAGWWAEHTPPRARVELTALARTGSRDAVVILATTALGTLAWSLAGRQLTALVVLGTAALVALAAVAWRATRRKDGRALRSTD